MLKHYVSFEENQGDHEVKIFISGNCPLGLVHDALFKARSYVIDKMNEAQKADAPKESEQEKIE